MPTKNAARPGHSKKVRAALATQPGLSVKDLSQRLRVNRQFMAGALAVMEEHGDVSCRQVGPARIYFLAAEPEKRQER